MSYNLTSSPYFLYHKNEICWRKLIIIIIMINCSRKENPLNISNIWNISNNWSISNIWTAWRFPFFSDRWHCRRNLSAVTSSSLPEILVFPIFLYILHLLKTIHYQSIVIILPFCTLIALQLCLFVIVPENNIGATGNFSLQFPGICLWRRSQNFLLIGFLNWHQPALCNEVVYDDYRPDIVD